VTPLVDITLVLLIIFMVTAKLIAGQSVPLDLPHAATAGTTQTVLTLVIDANNRVHLNGRVVADKKALQSEARRALQSDPKLRTLISASRQASHGSVMHVLDSVREAGISKIAFAADKSQPPASFAGAGR
jgi:biopolymer transport protein ExbD